MRFDMVVNLKWGWQAYTTKTVRDICTFTLLFSVSWPFLIFLFQTCLWRAIYAVLLGHSWCSCFWLEVCCFFSRIKHLSFIFARFFFQETAVVLIRELWFAGQYLSTTRVGFRTPAEGVITFGDLAFVCRFARLNFHSPSFSCRASPLFFFHSLFFAIRPN